ncbi:Crp/Fnr family transcriptional regulator [Paracoccus sp. N5]|uniref:Crp/Fnr family transcriptional regulator n=1 Tax=Paracoccus sp. N5 TaxID=1101189 RepID=UPI00037469F4|nr:Crp/Fnr family transcriptional regulator [Paracoccus sp. N5]
MQETTGKTSRGPGIARDPHHGLPWFPYARWDTLLPDLLDGISPERRRAFYAECTPRAYPQGAEILRQGEEAYAAFLIVEGRVEVTFVDVNGNTVLAHVAGPGEVMGEVELFSGKTCAASCRALPDSKLLIFNEALLMKYVSAQRLLKNFAAILHGRLVRDNRLHAIAQFYPAEARICLHLLRLSSDRAEVHVSQSQIALLAGCTRQTVNRTLAQLRDQRIIEMGRGMIRVLDPGRLTHKQLV